ncbi:MAG: ABC transporter ATP-binding protein [candidate division WOR-3 bacterium]
MGINTKEILEVKNLSAGYMGMKVLDKISLKLEKGEIVAIVGPNGSGKTTVLRCMVGLIEEYGGRIYEGEIIYGKKIINGKKPHELLSLGIAFVPDGGKVFPNMSVLENLEMGGYLFSEKKILDKRINDVLELFPILKGLIKRRAGSLSTGERQILSLARALITNPKVLLLDEPSLGLSPNYTRILFEKLLQLKEYCGIIVVEQNAKIALGYSDRGYLIRNGIVSFEGNAKMLLEKEDVFKL